MNANTDYHLHTYYSDGTLSPVDLLKWAKENNLTTVAVTDHDGTEGVREAQIAGEALNIKVLAGIELSSQTDFSFTDFRGKNKEPGIGIHILGYNIDTENKDLIEVCETIREWRRKRNEKLIEAICEAGMPLEITDIETGKAKDFIGKPNIARALVKKRYIKSVDDAFADGGIFTRPEVRKIKKQKLDSGDAIDIIKRAGGIPVLAHPGIIRHIGKRGTRENYENLRSIVSALKTEGLRGLECFYKEHTREEKIEFASIADKYKLHITNGSDYHGPGGGHGADD